MYIIHCMEKEVWGNLRKFICMMSNVLENILNIHSKSVLDIAVDGWLSVSDRSSWSVRVEMFGTPWLAYWSDSCPLTSGMEESRWVWILGQTSPPSLFTNQIIYTDSMQSKIVKSFCTLKGASFTSYDSHWKENLGFLSRHRYASMKLWRLLSICWTKT